MEVVELGPSGVRVSRVGLGCNNFGSRIDFEATRAVVEAALAQGVTFFDTAEVYGNRGGSERMLGEILEGRRADVVLATKFGWDGDRGRGSADVVRAAIEGSLERLRTDYVDLYYLHRPDPDTPIAETLVALDELVTAGKARAIGCSNVSAAQLREADVVARELGTERFVAVQNRLSILEPGDRSEALPAARELGLGYVPYFPLASGLLTGKYHRDEPPPEGTRLHGRQIEAERFDRLDALARFAAERGRTLHELALSALVSTPGIASVIAGATKPEQVRANVAAASWRLSEDELDALGRV